MKTSTAMDRTGYGRALPCALSLIGLGLSGPTAAADNTEAPTSRAAIEEIVVTAQKRAEKAQDVPVALTAYSGEELIERGVSNVRDISALVPNVQLGVTRGGSGSGGPVFIRGVGQTDPLPTAHPGVGVYVDDLYLARMFGNQFDMLDIERVEVLRGPQGTLYGKDSVGGAINVHSKEPSTARELDVALGLGDYGRTDLKVSGNTPLGSDSLLLRATVFGSQLDGYTRNSVNGDTLDERDFMGVRALTKFVASEQTDALVTLEYARSHNGINPGRQVRYPATVAAGNPDPFKSASELVDPHADTNTTTAALHVTHAYSESLSLKSITGYRRTNENDNNDYDGTADPAIRVHELDVTQHHKQFSQEFQLTGDALDGSLEWVTGLYYLQEKGDYFEQNEIVRLGGFRAPLDIDYKNESIAAYLHGSWTVKDDLRLSLGGRVIRDDKEATRVNYVATPGGPARGWAQNPTVPFGTGSNDWTAFTPKIGLDWKATPDALLYASVARGFKSGQITTRGATSGSPTLTQLEPEYVWSYEVGAKTEWFDRRLRANLAVFLSDYTNIQLQSFQVTSTSIGSFALNAPEATMKGAELEVTARPLENLELGGSYGYIDAEYDRFVDAQGREVYGRKFPYTPKQTYNLYAAWTIELAEAGGITLRADYAHQTSRFHDIDNTATLEQPSYGLLNARVTWVSPSATLEIAAYGRNLTDEEYIQNGLALGAVLSGNSTGFFGPPRTLGLDMTYHFR